jgi:hypothetical protein
MMSRVDNVKIQLSKFAGDKEADWHLRLVILAEEAFGPNPSEWYTSTRNEIQEDLATAAIRVVEFVELLQETARKKGIKIEDVIVTARKH